MLIEKLLPEEPELVRVVICEQGPYSPRRFVFGTQMTLSRGQARDRRLNHNALRTNWPEIFAGMSRDNELSLPKGWEKNSWSMCDFHDVAMFVGFCFEAQAHFRWPKGMPLEVGMVLAGLLQLGEKPSFRNFKRYLDLKWLKFLPLTIDPILGYRFYVFEPTPERIYRATNVFANVLEEVRGFEAMMPMLLRQLYALIRLDEVSVAHELVQDAQVRLEEAMSPATSGLSRCLSFVYEDMRGPKDAVLFDVGRYGRG